METIKSLVLDTVIYRSLLGLTMGVITIVAVLIKLAYIELRKRKPMYTYGTCYGIPARKHKTKGNVQFIMWKKGDQKDVDGIVHTHDKWINFDKSHWNGFEPYKNKKVL